MITMNISAMDAEQEQLNLNLWCEIFSIDLSVHLKIFNADVSREAIRQLLDAGADANSISPLKKSSVGTIPLIFAISIFDLELIELLINSGADINGSDPFLHINPIHRILDFLEFYSGENQQVKSLAYRILSLLVNKGANLRIRNQEGEKAKKRCKDYM